MSNYWKLKNWLCLLRMSSVPWFYGCKTRPHTSVLTLFHYKNTKNLFVFFILFIHLFHSLILLFKVKYFKCFWQFVYCVLACDFDIGIKFKDFLLLLFIQRIVSYFVHVNFIRTWWRMTFKVPLIFKGWEHLNYHFDYVSL